MTKPTARPEREDYRLLVQSSWADIHHSRGQDWRALLVVAGVHLAATQGLGAATQASLPIDLRVVTVSTCGVAALFVVLGILVTSRHYRLMRIMLGWIYEAEKELGLIFSEENPCGIIPREAKMERPLGWKGFRWPRRFSASWLIIAFYLALGVVDLAVATACLIS